MSRADFASGSPLSFALLSVSSLEESLAFYQDRIGLQASPVVELPAFEPGFIAAGAATGPSAAPALQRHHPRKRPRTAR